jgi:UDP-2-acetamido-3-amino-2,3-dideoxy-glucuronate N-acetyltransferase
VSDGLEASERAPGLHVAPGVEIPADARIAPHVTVYPGVEIGAGATLGQGAILGRPQEIDPRSRAEPRPPGEGTRVGAGVRIGSNSVIVAGARIGDGAYVGEGVMIRELAAVGDEAVIGTRTIVGVGTRVGPRSRLHAMCLVGPGTVIDEDVHISANVTFVSDATMGRRGAASSSRGIVVRRASRIGVGVIVLPPCEIGVEAVVGAASLVRGDVAPRTVVAGTPARPLREVRDDELLEEWTGLQQSS